MFFTTSTMKRMAVQKTKMAVKNAAVSTQKKL